MIERRTGRAGGQRSGRRRLTRKPKQLDSHPSLLGGTGGSSRGPTQKVDDATSGRSGGGDVEFTDDEGTGEDAAGVERTEAEPEVLRRAMEIAGLLARPRVSVHDSDRSVSGRMRSVRFDPDADELDLDRTIEALAEKPVLTQDDIVVRAKRHRPRSIALVVDVSGSMRGEKARMAAATVGALIANLAATDRLALIAFWSDAALLSHLGPPPPVHVAVRNLLALPTKGLTNIAFPLEVAQGELAGVPTRQSRVLLLSDCVHNAGPDPRQVAPRLARLDVLVDAVGEHDAELGREIAHEGRGQARVVRQHRDVAPALRQILQH